MYTRKKYIDIAKCIAICGVVFEHSQYFINTGRNFVAIRIWIISFFLQLFFVCSGITNKEIVLSKNNIGIFLQKKFLTLIIPYILWCFIYTPEINLNFLKCILWGTNESIEACGVNGVLWFFPVMFLSTIIFQIIYTLYVKRFKNSTWFLYFVFIGLFMIALINEHIVSQTWWFGANISIVGVLFIMIGYMAKKIVNYLYNLSIFQKIILLGITLCLSVFLANFNMPFYFDEYSTVHFEYAVWFARGLWGRNLCVFLLSSCCSCISVLLLSMIICENRFLEYLGKNTAVIMCMHMIIYSIIMPQLTPYFVNINLKYYDIITPLLCTAINIICSIPLIYFVSKYIPVLGGKAWTVYLEEKS